MMRKKLSILIPILGLILSCENEVDLNTDFEETAVVFGLLDHNADTQFIKINKTFLDDKQSAIDLAQQGDRIFFDTLKVSLIEKDGADTFRLQRINRPKDDGIFATDRNEAYYTDAPIKKNTTYQLLVEKPDGSLTIGETTTLDTIFIESPRLSFNSANKVTFFNRDLEFNDFAFRFSSGLNVAEFQVVAFFHYTEVLGGGDSAKRIVRIPLTQFDNPELSSNREFTFVYDGERFFKEIEDQVPESTNPTRKVVDFNDNFEIQIYIADEDFRFYRNLNGPIEGLAQVRPDFTNIEGGVGLFSSRLFMTEYSRLDENTRNYLVNTYKSSRNFIFP